MTVQQVLLVINVMCHSGIVVMRLQRLGRDVSRASCTESLSLPCPTCFTLLAVADDEKRL